MVQGVKIITDDTSMDSIIKEIIDNESDEGFYVCNVSQLVQQQKLWNETMPRIKPYYAVKCNPDKVIIETLLALGVNMDCASKKEMEAVLTAKGGSTERIVFSSSVKLRTHLKYAHRERITLTTVDNHAEMLKIKNYLPDAKLLIRIRCDDPSATFQLGKKFGCDPIEEAPKLISAAKNLGLEVAGIHFHIGSGFTDPTYFKKALEYAKDLFDIAKMLGYSPNVLDIGGGFTGSKPEDFRHVGKVINAAIEELFPEPEVRIIAEPGKFYVEQCCTLVTNVIGVRNVDKVKDGKSMEHKMYYMDKGIYESFYDAILHESFFPEPVKSNQHKEKLMSSSLWGPSLEPIDVVIKEWLLPELQSGDWLKFENMGAYSLALGSVQGFTQNKIYYVAHQTQWEQVKTA